MESPATDWPQPCTRLKPHSTAPSQVPDSLPALSGIVHKLEELAVWNASHRPLRLSLHAVWDSEQLFVPSGIPLSLAATAARQL